MIFIEVAFLAFLVFAHSVLSQNCSETVTLNSTNLNYTFTSPNYPNHHGQAWCTWVINAPTAQTMKLECPDLDTIGTFDCYLNFLGYTAGGQSTRYCGRSRRVERSDSVTTITVSFLYPFPFNFWVNGFKCTASFTPTSPSSTPSPTTPSPTTPLPPQPPVQSNCNCGIDRPGDTRIVGGEDAELHEFPWMVALRYRNMQFCGGSLISPEWVLTAAHCLVEGLELDKMHVSLADHHKLSSDETDKTIHLKPIKIVLHPDWDRPTIRNDIALIKIPKLALTDEISPICLPIKSKNVSGKKGRAIGWGRTAEGGDSALILQKIEMNLLTSSECRDIWNRTGNVDIANYMTCAYKEGIGGTCQGDSGGSLFLKEGIHNFEMGIVSFGISCARKDFPGVYTRVESFIDWIKTTTGESFCVK